MFSRRLPQTVLSGRPDRTKAFLAIAKEEIYFILARRMTPIVATSLPREMAWPIINKNLNYPTFLRGNVAFSFVPSLSGLCFE
jgi:hypothetical protein